MRRPAGLLFTPLFLLAGCGQSAPADAGAAPPLEEPTVLGSHRGMPAGLPADARSGRPTAAILGAGRLALTTWGSSSCPELPTRMDVTPSGALRVVLRLDAGPNQVCTADIGPTTTRLGVDPELTADDSVQVLVVFPGEAEDLRVTARPVEGG